MTSGDDGSDGGDDRGQGVLEYVDQARMTPKRISEAKEIIREELGLGVDDDASGMTELLERILVLDQRSEEHSQALELLEGLVKSVAKSLDALAAGLAVALSAKRIPSAAAKGKSKAKRGSKSSSTKR